MRVTLYFAIIIFLCAFASVFCGCDAAEDFAEEQVYLADTTVVVVDTIKTKVDIKFSPVTLDLVIELGSFLIMDNAEKFAEKADSVLKKRPELISEDRYILVTVGRFTDPEKANAYLEYVKGKGYKDAFVKKIKKTE